MNANPHDQPHMFEGVSSNPEMEWPTETYAESGPGGHVDEDPIRVIVVDTVEPSNLTDWSAEQFNIGYTANIRIAGGKRNRTNLIIRNLGPDLVYLVKGSVSPFWTGFPLPSGSSESLDTNMEVWAVCEQAKGATVGVIQQFTVDTDE